MVKLRKRITIPIDINGTVFSADFLSFSGFNDEKEHIAIIFNKGDKEKIPLVRVHSECLTGDIFGSCRCDCGPQLNEALMRMCNVGGILIYMRQEGRGIGLYNKLDAYYLQDAGYDTYQANNLLGFENDLRDFSPAAEILKALEIESIVLITNNPEKVRQMQKNGIEISERKSTHTYLNADNHKYLKAKMVKAGHSLKIK